MSSLAFSLFSLLSHLPVLAHNRIPVPTTFQMKNVHSHCYNVWGRPVIEIQGSTSQDRNQATIVSCSLTAHKQVVWHSGLFAVQKLLELFIYLCLQKNNIILVT